MAIIWTDVTDFDASLTAVPGNAQTLILGYVNASINVAVLDGESGFDTKLARIYLAAHMGLGALPGAGLGGVVTSEAGGDGLSVSYAVAPAALIYGSLAETAWGRRYLALVRTSCAGGVLL